MDVKHIWLYRLLAENKSSLLTDYMHLFLVKHIREGEGWKRLVMYKSRVQSK